MLLSIEQVKEIWIWLRRAGPKFKDYDKPIVLRVVLHTMVMLFTLTIIVSDNVALEITARLVFLYSLVHTLGYIVLSIKRAEENWENRKALEDDSVGSKKHESASESK